MCITITRSVGTRRNLDLRKKTIIGLNEICKKKEEILRISKSSLTTLTRAKWAESERNKIGQHEVNPLTPEDLYSDVLKLRKKRGRNLLVV